MASIAFTQHFFDVLADADELLDAHRQLRLQVRGRQWGRGSLHRAVVVSCVSAWEAYIEKVVMEAVDKMEPPAGSPQGSWPGLKAAAKEAVKRFNTPNVDNVKKLVANTIGLENITACWSWKNCKVDAARKRLNTALDRRHHSAHGVIPRPKLTTRHVTDLVTFFRKLGLKTDTRIRDFLVNTLGIPDPWPP